MLPVAIGVSGGLGLSVLIGVSIFSDDPHMKALGVIVPAGLLGLAIAACGVWACRELTELQHLGTKAHWENRWVEIKGHGWGTPARAASLIATIAVIIGFADLPYGYYQLLRLCLCGISLFLAFGANLALDDWHRWVLGGFAFLYNPVLPIRIGEKGLWEILNVATVILFWVVNADDKRR
jgi:hypothetical protein